MHHLTFLFSRLRLLYFFFLSPAELSPIMVHFTEQRKSLLHFLTQLCAILGGVFTVSGMLDRIVRIHSGQMRRLAATAHFRAS